MEIEKDNLKGKTTINNNFVPKHDFGAIIQILTEKIKAQDSKIEELKSEMFWTNIFITIMVGLNIIKWFFN